MPTSRSNSHSGSATLFGVVLVVAVLYFAREVFIPLTLAILFAFLLGPLVARLRQWGLWRVPAVLSVVILTFVLVAVVCGLVAAQMTDLGKKLPEYQQNIRNKLQSVRDSSGGVIGRITRVVRDFTDELNPPPQPSPNNPNQEKPVPVEIRRTTFSPLEVVRSVLGSVVSLLMMGAIVVVFVIFMLLEREDLRDRFIRLIGSRQMNLTTKALDEAAHRVSRYLVAQLVVNIAFGVPAGVALYFIGVPNSALWGTLAALLRYIPYLGIWIAALIPAALAFAVDPGWSKPLLVIGTYFGIDLMMYNFVEPLFYGSSTGLTPLAILVAAVFWTWLWGPVGLLLATPLTVCVAVLGRYVPSLRFLQILLSDEPVLPLEKRFYQRLLAGDTRELTEISEEWLKGKTLEEFYDEIVIPALHLAEQDRHGGRLDEQQQQAVYQSTRALLEDIGGRADKTILGEHATENGREPRVLSDAKTPADAIVLAIPARDQADELGALMVAQLLNRRDIRTRSLPAGELVSECVEEAARANTRIVCVAAVPPFGHVRARYLCKRLRAQFPEIKIVVAILDCPDILELKKQQPSIPADTIAGNLTQTIAGILTVVPSVKDRSEQTAFSS